MERVDAWSLRRVVVVMVVMMKLTVVRCVLSG